MVEVYNSQYNRTQQDVQKIMQNQNTSNNSSVYRGTPFG